MTIPQLFLSSVEKYHENPFLWEKLSDVYKSITYSECRNRVMHFAAGLISMGALKGDKYILLSEGRSEWVIAELGILFAGGVSVPVSVKIEEQDELIFRIVHSESSRIVVSEKQLPKILQILKKIPLLKNIIVLGNAKDLPDKAIAYEDMMNRGSSFMEGNPAAIDIYKELTGSDYANICYTSGTTADPKGIILTHSNYIVNTEQACSLFPVPEWYTSLMILPWDHSFAHTVGIYTLMKNGASLASVQSGKTLTETLKNISINIKETKPVFLLSVPALAKNFKNNIEKSIRDKGVLVNMLFRAGLQIAFAYNNMGYNKGKGFRKLLLPLYAIFDSLIFKKIRTGFGGRLRFFIGGGALLDLEFQKFFYALGIPMYQGYGLTEASPVISSNNPEYHKFGSSGRPVSFMELKICDEKGNELPCGSKGEIVIRGGNVMAGYWKNEQATAETIRNGWLYTGDMGYLDSDGFLYVLGRFKSLLIGSDGEKFSPEGIEEALTSHSPFIEQVMLHNNQQAYTVALIYPAIARIKQHIHQHHQHILPGSSEWSKQALMLVKTELAQYLHKGHYENMFPGRWIPSAFSIIPEAFTEQNRLINASMKMVRGKITEKYQEEIAFMYTVEGKDVMNEKNISQMAVLSQKE